MPIPVAGGLGDVQSGFTPLPAGTYDVEVLDASEETAGPDAKNPGTPYLKLEFQVTDEEYSGRKVWLNASFSEKARGILKGTLLGLGFTEEELASPDLEIDPEELIGRTAKAVVSEGTNPKTKERNNSVKRLLPMSETETELPG